ncbi:MAG: translation initiation factor IF-2 [Actinomycetota bacterium]
MARPRVHEVAKELGLTSKEVLAHLEQIGQPVKSHSSSIEEDLAARVRSELGDGAKPGSAEPTKAPAEPTKAPAAKPKASERKAEPARAPAQQPKAPPRKQAEAPATKPPAKPAAEPKPAPESPPEPVAAAVPEEEPESLRVHRGITVQEFAERVDRPANEIVKILFGLGEMVTVAQSMSDDAVELVAEELGVSIAIVDPSETEETADAEAPEGDEGVDLIIRPPVVTVMGHVDHGKTTILDAIRKTDVVSGEAGGITQAIGAYRVHAGEREITFIDTPGHEAFTAMRARGAQVTDLAVLVVAADDGVMPQTVEAIDHAKAARVPIVVAVNKIDKPESDPNRVRQELTQYELVPEEWGGDTVFVDVSAKENQNLDQLLEMILLTTDVQLDLRANPEALARGVVIEAHLDKGRGPVASVLVKRGTLYKGDAMIAGVAWGRVRAMLDERGNEVDEAGPGVPVQILGWQALPDAGDDFKGLEDEREARAISNERQQHRRAAEQVARKPASLAALLAQTKEGEIPELNLLVKSDAQGSAEALEGQLAKMDQSTVKVNVLRKGVGAITENDITLAQASDALVIGFNVVPTVKAQNLAEEEAVDVRTYRVIYQAIEDIERAAHGMLGPQLVEKAIGQAEVRALFRVPRAGTIAGCMVLNGVIRRNARARVVRDGAIIYESTISSLKRFKDDAREVAQGYECGIGVEGFNDIKEGDVIEAVEVEEVER